LLSARTGGKENIKISPDLGLTTVEALLSSDRATFPSGESLSFDELEKICSCPKACFLIDRSGISPIRAFSEEFGRAYSLLPTESAPALMLSGFLMHRIRNTNPWRAADLMAGTLYPIKGTILDTATGLGYTAIRAAALGAKVVTIEVDPMVREIARQNPWSRALFDNPAITLLTGDCAKHIETCSDESFSSILHDPPAFDLAGELYSAAFYRQAWRVLSRRGRMFHYIGDPASANGAKVTNGVLRRMKEAGFTRIIHRPEAFGVTAFKAP
jgi:predicted methyltransferase